LAEANIGAYLSLVADSMALRLLPQWTSLLIGHDHDRELARTLSAFADASLNVKQYANRLDVHVNTVYHRLKSGSADRPEDLRRNLVANDRTHDSLTARVARPAAASFGGRHIENDPACPRPASIEPAIPNGVSPVDAQFV
jgi:hypothetical protein